MKRLNDLLWQALRAFHDKDMDKERITLNALEMAWHLGLDEGTSRPFCCGQPMKKRDAHTYDCLKDCGLVKSEG